MPCFSAKHKLPKKLQTVYAPTKKYCLQTYFAFVNQIYSLPNLQIYTQPYCETRFSLLQGIRSCILHQINDTYGQNVTVYSQKTGSLCRGFFRRLIHLTTLKIYAMPNRYTENQGQKQRGAY